MKTNCRIATITLVAVVFFVTQLEAVEINGTVRSVSDDVTTIIIEGESVPNVGDPVQIYFKLPGAEVEVSVGKGKVTAVKGDSVDVKIDKATGTVTKGQLARITSDKPQKRIAAAPTTGSPSAKVEAAPETQPSPTSSPGGERSLPAESSKSAAGLPSAAPSRIASLFSPSTGGAPIQAWPDATPSRLGKIVSDDPFDDPHDPLQASGNRNVNSEREMSANPGASRSRSYLPVVRDLYLEFYARATGSPCWFGTLFRTQSKGDTLVTYYAVLIQPQPSVLRIAAVKDGHIVAVQDGALPASILMDPKRKIQLGVEVIGNRFRIFIDEKLIAQFTNDMIPAAGAFTLCTAATGDQPSTVYFDNLKAYDLAASRVTRERKPRSHSQDKRK